MPRPPRRTRQRRSVTARARAPQSVERVLNLILISVKAAIPQSGRSLGISLPLSIYPLARGDMATDSQDGK